MTKKKSLPHVKTGEKDVALEPAQASPRRVNISLQTSNQSTYILNQGVPKS